MTTLLAIAVFFLIVGFVGLVTWLRDEAERRDRHAAELEWTLHEEERR